MPTKLIRNYTVQSYMTEADVERNMDLIREILLFVEKNGTPGVNLYEHQFEVGGQLIGRYTA